MSTTSTPPSQAPIRPGQSAKQSVKPSVTRPARRYLFKLTVISTLGGLLFGYDTGVISGALIYMKQDLHLSALGEASVVSSLLFGAMFGALLGGKLADRLGRKGGLLVCAVLFLFGALGSALAPQVALMVAARIVLGLAVGAASVTVPVYLAEVAPAHRRGRMVTINELMIVIGQLLAFVVNVIIDKTFHGADVWRWMLAVAATPAVLLFVGMLLLPDSPRWYAVKGRLEDTRRVLSLSRGPDAAAEEYDAIVEQAQRDMAEDKGAALRDLRAQPWMRKILYIGIGLAVVQQLTGINTAMYYAPTILQSTGLGASASLVATVSVGVISVVGVALGIFLLGFVDRRRLLSIGFTGVAVSQLALASSFLLPTSTVRSYIVLAGIVSFVAFMQACIGTCVWLILSEIFPMTIRGFAMGLSVFVLWTTNTIVSFVFPILVAAAGPSLTFGMFFLLNIASLIFVIRYAPETRGRTLEGLEQEFRTRYA